MSYINRYDSSLKGYGMEKFELFTVPQRERVKALETTVIAWMNGLAANEQLVIGLPEVLDKWDECVPLIVGPGMQDQFLAWLRTNAKDIEGPVYNLPRLTADFLCIVVDKDYDPRKEEPPKGASRELLATLTVLGSFMTEHETRTA